jgi:transcriptional regulator with XRE-family HTH domain
LPHILWHLFCGIYFATEILPHFLILLTMLKEIRQHYGIGQSLFADYLGISRTQLSMAEIGQRNISTQNTLSILPLYNAITQTTSNEPDEKLVKELTTQKENLQQFISRRKKENEYKLDNLEEALATMKSDQNRCIQILGNLKNLQEGASPTTISLLTIIEIDARSLQTKTGADEQIKLALQIQHLQVELVYFDQYNNEQDKF